MESFFVLLLQKKCFFLFTFISIVPCVTVRSLCEIWQRLWKISHVERGVVLSIVTFMPTHNLTIWNVSMFIVNCILLLLSKNILFTVGELRFYLP